MLVERIGPLVHRMAGDRGDRAALFGQESGDLDVVHRDLAEHRFLATIGLGAERGAFEHLAVEIGEPLAIYINIAEQPARLQLDDSSLLVEWKLAYRRGYIMQARMVVVGGLLGVVAFLSTFEWRWLLGAVVFRVN